MRTTSPPAAKNVMRPAPGTPYEWSRSSAVAPWPPTARIVLTDPISTPGARRAHAPRRRLA
jgi:hypothetical protein